ncbi:MAG: hypothetical protein Q9218_006882 [Villophora microphyllina]
MTRLSVRLEMHTFDGHFWYGYGDKGLLLGIHQYVQHFPRLQELRIDFSHEICWPPRRTWVQNLTKEVVEQYGAFLDKTLVLVESQQTRVSDKYFEWSEFQQIFNSDLISSKEKDERDEDAFEDLSEMEGDDDPIDAEAISGMMVVALGPPVVIHRTDPDTAAIEISDHTLKKRPSTSAYSLHTFNP